MVADPLAPFVVAKKPFDDEVLRLKVVVPLLVVGFPNWSSSCRASPVSVVVPAAADDGLGATATWVAAPTETLMVAVPQVVEPFLAVMVGVAAVLSP
jgi:hypothetical protein